MANEDELSKDEIEQRVKAAFAPYLVGVSVTLQEGLVFEITDVEHRRSVGDRIRAPDQYRTPWALDELLRAYRTIYHGQGFEFDPWP